MIKTLHLLELTLNKSINGYIDNEYFSTISYRIDLSISNNMPKEGEYRVRMTTIVVAAWLAFQLRIRELPYSKFIQNTDNTDRGISWMSSVITSKYLDNTLA
jgi:hypothetical protein